MTVYSVFGQVSPGTSAISDTTDYTFGMQFTLSQSATLTGIWFFSPTGATALPVACCIYQQTSPGSGSQVAGSVNTSPTWSGAAASGWVKVTYVAGPTLTAGPVYKVCVLKDTTALVYSSTANYWSSGAGSGGVTSGIISAPNNAGGDGGQDTFVNPVVVLTYPASSFNASNYWIDVEVTTASPPPPSPPAYVAFMSSM